jgi:hypothetical protein
VAETGSTVGNLRDGVRGFFHPQSPKEAQFHKVQPAPTPKVLLRKLKKEPVTGMRQVVKKAGVTAGYNPISWSAGPSMIHWSTLQSMDYGLYCIRSLRRRLSQVVWPVF